MAPTRGPNVVVGTPEGWAKHEVEVMHGADKGADGDTGATWGVGRDIGACGASGPRVALVGVPVPHVAWTGTPGLCVVGRGSGPARGTGGDTRAVHGMAIVSEVPATEEGYGRAIAGTT
jgi:hypothetical protein